MAHNVSPTVHLEKISKRFPGVQALDQVSLDIYPGEIHAIIGENGAGKSTLMNVLAGEVRPDSGRIIYLGEEREIPDPHISQQLGISVVYQETALCPNLSAAENVSLNTAPVQPALSFVNRRGFLETAKETLARLGMDNIDLSVPVNRFTIAPDFEMQSWLLSRTLTHSRYALAFLYCVAFFHQQRRVVPVSTQVGVVVLDDNKLTVSD